MFNPIFEVLITGLIVDLRIAVFKQNKTKECSTPVNCRLPEYEQVHAT